MAFLIVLGIIALAAVYGLFFLLFKLIAMLAQKPGYKWPLILAGVATLLVGILAGVAAHRLYQRFMYPFQPILQTVSTQKNPIYGQRLYIDPTYGFSVTQYNGTVFSRWIDINGVQLLLGIDTNVLLSPAPEPQAAPFMGFILLRNAVAENTTAEQVMQQLYETLQKPSERDITLHLATPQAITLGDYDNAAFLTAILETPQLPEDGLPLALLVAVQQNHVYYFIGLSNQSDQMMINTLQSFRFAN